MLAFLSRWLKTDARPTKSTRPKLRLEALEAREVPTVNFWLNVNSTYGNSANWLGGVPTWSDVLVFPPYFPAPPTLGEEGQPSPPPPPPVSVGTTFPTTGATNFAGIRFEWGYSGTVTFPASITFGGYYQDCGTTVQGSATTTTVTSGFTWTGGSINASGVAGDFQLGPAAVGVIDPGDGNTVTLGDTLTLLGDATNPAGATLTHESGTWHLSQGSGIVVEAWSSLNLISGEVSDPTSPPPPAPPDPLPAGQRRMSVTTSQQTVLIKKDGYLKYYPDNYDVSKQYRYEEEASISNQGGLIKVYQKTDVKFTVNSIPYVNQSSGTTQLEAGSSFTGSSNDSFGAFSYSGGRFEVMSLPNVAQNDQPPVVINGSFRLNTNAVLVMPDTTIYSSLQINGDFWWRGGEVRLAIGKPGGVLKSDQINVTGKVHILYGPKLQIRWSTEVPPLTDNPSWDLITSTSPIENVTNVTLTTDVPNDPLSSKFELALTQNQKKLFVRKNN